MRIHFGIDFVPRVCMHACNTASVISTDPPMAGKLLARCMTTASVHVK